jgi:two-component system nitrate/nitrite response regulator NarL
MRILVADNQAKVRNALRVLLMRQPGLEVVGEAASAGEVLAKVRVARPDLVLLHWRLQEESASDLLTSLRGACPGLCVIALSARPELCQAALRGGADDFVSKVDPPERLLAAIRSTRERLDRDVSVQSWQPSLQIKAWAT